MTKLPRSVSSASATSATSHVGPDGLTKPQRYLAKNRTKINAKNALRNRIRRQKEKLLRQEEAEIQAALEIESNLNNSSKSPTVDCVLEHLTEQGQSNHFGMNIDMPMHMHTDKAIQTDSGNEPRPDSYYTSKEYYLSQEFDDLMDQKLSKLERLDRAAKAEVVYEQAMEQYNEFQTSLKKRWTIQSGWKYPRKFKGSKLQEQCQRLQTLLYKADELSSNVLQETPANSPEWFESFIQLRDIVGKQAHLKEIYHTLMYTM